MMGNFFVSVVVEFYQAIVMLLLQEQALSARVRNRGQGLPYQDPRCIYLYHIYKCNTFAQDMH